RLMLRLRQQEGLSYGAGAELMAGSDEASGAWQMSASCAPQNFARLKAAFGEEFQRWVQQGISQQELRDARSGLLKEMHLARSDDAVLAGMLLEQLRLGRTLDFTAQLEKQLAALPLDQVNASLRRIMGNAGLLTVAAGDWEPHK
ncbi:MAG: M16 family metallopeptidase, partial [Burkholderiales bacterium]